jgi:hypothetical protein
MPDLFTVHSQADRRGNARSASPAHMRALVVAVTNSKPLFKRSPYGTSTPIRVDPRGE